MPLNIDLNTAPYWDDYNANNQYYRILFKPAQAVQARELTQVQSILQNQIEQFGNWAFQNGDIVSGCAITDAPITPFVRLADYTTNGASYSVSNTVNTQVYSLQSNLTARVIYGLQGLISNYPNTNIVYIVYTNTGNSGQQTFSNTDQLQFVTIPSNNTAAVNIYTVNTYPANSTSNTYTTGNAHAIYVSDGVVFINGEFVNVLQPTFGLVNAYGTNAGNNVVGFVLAETIVTSAQDTSLLDNALGYGNENAPGADRLKLVAGLLSLDPVTAANTAGFNPIATYNYGSLISSAISSSNLYSIVGSAVAAQMYNTDGNFVVNPFTVDTITSSNSIVANLSSNNMLARVQPGMGYAQGYEVEILKTAYVNMRRGVDTQVVKQQQITFNYGSYFILDEVAGTFDFKHANTVTLYNAPQQAVTKRQYTNVTPTGNNIGNASCRCFTYNSGVPGSNTAQYYLHVYNISMATGYNTNAIASVYFGNTGVGDLAVTGLQGAGYDDQLFSFGVPGIMVLRDGSNNINTEYVYRTSSTTTLAANGVAVYTIPTSATGGVDELPYGVGILSDLNAANFTVINTANAQSAALAGTLNVNTTSNVVIGSSTNFLNNFSNVASILVGTDVRTVTGLVNSTYMTVDNAFSVANTVAAYYRFYPAGKILPVIAELTDTPGSITISNSTSFTLNYMYGSGCGPASSTPLTIVYDTLRTSASPATKSINKNRYVTLNTTTNPTGPWCLGFGDVHQVTGVYASASATYGTNGAQLTSSFVLDSGQRDAFYSLGYLYLKPGTSITSTPYLTVQLDYLSSNTAPGLGFFTVESYPIDDANTANTTAIQTFNIPMYVDGAGNQIYLRDYVDFRTPVLSTANDTGYVSTSNSTAVATAVTYATNNPANTVAFQVPTNGLNMPAYSQNFQADYIRYLPRMDLVLITPNNVLKVKEGVSSTSPQVPLYPDNAMVVAVLNIPPYPSLTTDQVDDITVENQGAVNLSRDTSTAITSSIVTYRRYTMADVGTLDNRITNLEYYASLSLLQQTAQNLTVTDVNGLDRFKNGIFADPFQDFSYSAVSDPEFSIAIDTNGAGARPKIVREVISVKFNSATSSGVQQTGRSITLPYTEVPFISQPYATKYRSAALVAFSWNGTMILLPSYDNQIDTTTTGSVNINTGTSQFANSPFASIYGDWRTAANVVTTTTSTNTSISTKAKSTSTPYVAFGQAGPGAAGSF